jgi:hypothetical protein
VTRLEEQLREAYREAGETVRPGTVRGLRDRAVRKRGNVPPTGNVRRARRATQVLAPLAAAACVAAFVVIASAVSPHPAGSRDHAARPGTTKPARRSGTSALAGLPEFTVLNNGSSLAVVATATGHVTGRLAAPPGQAFAQIAGTAGDRVFYATADLSPQTSCRTFLYRIGLSAAGRPMAPTPLTARQMSGLPTALAASADGALLAYSVVECAAGNTPGHIAANQAIGQIGLIDVASDSVTRQWSYSLSEDSPSDLSLSATGSLLGYSIFMESASYSASPVQVARVLATSARPGPDYLRSRVVVRQPGGAQGGIVSTALSSSGALIYAITSASGQMLAAYDTSDGRQVQVLHSWPSATLLGQLRADPAGGYLLLTMAGHGSRPAPGTAKGCVSRIINAAGFCERGRPYDTVFVSIDLATGSMAPLPFTMTGPPGSGQVAW